ncbi:MAG: DUF1902 domain-containing protein [Hyphomicrobium sp.]|nr:DUF1902 domain-containing protein [Hyphomicrobium sp.]
MQPSSIIVRAFWDEEACVWIAETRDIDGLATEADTLEALRDKVLVMLPELLELNGAFSGVAEVPVHIIAEHLSRVQNPAFV